MEEILIKINSHKAETLYISHPEASYGIFCFNSVGDLFLNSDWGGHYYSWRSFGDHFKKFLGQCNTEYLIGKFETNWQQNTKKKMHPMMKKNIIILLEQLIKHCEKNPEWTAGEGCKASVEFIDDLLCQSFDGWSDESKRGYVTAMTTIKEKYK